MKLRTWSGSTIETHDYTWRIWPMWALGWLRRFAGLTPKLKPIKPIQHRQSCRDEDCTGCKP